MAFAPQRSGSDRRGLAHGARRLHHDELRRLGRYPLIMVDQLGYIPFEAATANLFFQLCGPDTRGRR